MSRTIKDKPYKVRFPENNRMHYPYHENPSGSITKKKRFYKPDWDSFYMATPSIHTRLCMTKRRRRENRVYESVLKQVPLELLETYEPFLNWKRPHIDYY